MSRRTWIRVVAAGLVACGVAATETYPDVPGVVQGVDPDHRQLKIAHDEIPGFMPAMTMSFDVAEPRLFEGVEPGQRVRFDLERSGTTLRITGLELLGKAEAAPAVSAPRMTPLEDAPEFALTDQRGARLALSELRGKAVLLDFVFTRCQGPCPILTRAHVELQRELPDGLRGRTHFLSVSIDPEYDTPERLRAYAEERGADLARWSFLTGTPQQVQRILDDYRVGTIRQPDGTLDHVVVTFLIDPKGRIAQHYLGLEHPLSQIRADLESLW